MEESLLKNENLQIHGQPETNGSPFFLRIEHKPACRLGENDGVKKRPTSIYPENSFLRPFGLVLGPRL
jgi:hypothetical protein